MTLREGLQVCACREMPGMDHFAKAEGKAAASRARIVATAAPLFAERGFGGASIRDIAQAAGLTTASLYYHFAGKDDLFVAVHARALAGVAEAVARAVATLTDPWDRLEAAAGAHCAALLEKGTAAVLVDMMYGGASEVRDELVRQRDEYEKSFRTFVDAAPMRTGVNRHLARLQILGALNFMAFWYNPKGVMSAAEIGRALVRNMRVGLAPSAGEAQETGARAAPRRDRRKS